MATHIGTQGSVDIRRGRQVMRKVGMQKVSLEILEKAMAMPPDHKIINILSLGADGVIHVYVEGPQMPEHQVGDEVTEVMITIQQRQLVWIKVEPV